MPPLKYRHDLIDAVEEISGGIRFGTINEFYLEAVFRDSEDAWASATLARWLPGILRLTGSCFPGCNRRWMRLSSSAALKLTPSAVRSVSTSSSKAIQSAPALLVRILLPRPTLLALSVARSGSSATRKLSQQAWLSSGLSSRGTDPVKSRSRHLAEKRPTRLRCAVPPQRHADASGRGAVPAENHEQRAVLRPFRAVAYRANFAAEPPRRRERR